MPNSPDPLSGAAADMVSDDQAQSTQALRASLFVAKGQDPDQAAAAQRVGVSPAALKVAPDLAQPQPQPEEIAAATPRTAAALADPQFAAKAHDDIQSLQQTEQTMQGWKQAQDDTQALIAKSQANEPSIFMRSPLVPDWAKDPVYAARRTIAALAQQAGDLPGAILTASEAATGPLPASWDAALRQKFAENPVLRFAAVEKLTSENPAFIKDQAEGVGKLWASDKPGAVALAARKTSELVGSFAPYIAGEILSGGTATVAFALGAGAEGSEEGRANGLSPAMSTLNAAGKAGTFYAAGKLVTMLPIKYLQGVLGRYVGDGVATTVVGGALTAALKTTLRQFFHGAVAGAGLKGGNALTDYLTGADPHALDDIGSQMLQQGLELGVTGPLLGGMEIAGAFHEQAPEVQTAALAKQHLLALGDLTRESKLAARDPEAWQTFLQAQTEGTHAEHLHIAPKDFEDLAAKHGVDPVQVATELGAHHSYADAKKSGADMQVDSSAVLAKLSGHPMFEDFLDKASVKPGGMTMAGVEDLRQQMRQEVRDAENADEQSLEKVRQDRIQQMTATGIPQSQAEAEAEPFAQFVRTQLPELRRNPGHENDTAEDFVKQYGLNEQTPQELSLLQRASVALGLKKVGTEARLAREAKVKEAQENNDFKFLESPAAAPQPGEIDEKGMTNEERHKFEDQQLAEERRNIDEMGGLAPVHRWLRENGGARAPIGNEADWKDVLGSSAKAGAKQALDERLDEMMELGVVPHGTDLNGLHDIMEKEQLKVRDYAAQYGKKGVRSISARIHILNQDPTTGPYSEGNISVDKNGAGVSMDSRPLPEADELKRLREENQSLKKELRTSEKTGLPNLRAFTQDHAAKPFDHVAAFDLNNFKALNTAVGHEAVDREVLPAVGEALQKASKDLGLEIYHRSGDEFQVGVRDKDQAATDKLMDKLMKRMESIGIDVQGTDKNGAPVHYQIDGIGATYGIGKEYKDADAAAEHEKERLRSIGALQDLRARGGIPDNLRRIEPRGTAGSERPSETVQSGGRSAQGLTLEQRRLALRDAASNNEFSLFQKNNGTPNAQIDFENGPNGFKATITRFAKANLSSGIHELGHYMLETMRRLAAMPNASEQVKADLAKLEEYAKVKDGDWQKDNHETVARGLEKYVMEGKAPSVELRPVFARLKSWMASVYKSIKDIVGPQLNDDVRAVFDRMLATPEQIALAHQSQGREAWISPTDNPDYAKALERAHESAEADLTFKANADIRRHQTRAWQAEAEKNEAELKPELASTRPYRAIQAFRGKDFDGKELPAEQTMKINREALSEAYGKTSIPGARGAVVREGGMHPDAAAELLGYKNAQEMMDELAGTKPFKQALDARVKEVTDFTHNPLPGPDAMADQAREAVHNEDSGKVLLMEQKKLLADNLPTFKALMKKMAVLMPRTEDIKQQAKEMLSGQRVGSVNSNLYSVGEAKARREAMELYSKGDIEGAFDAKRRERLNHELFRAATEAKESVQDGLDYLSRFNKANLREKIDLPYREQIDALLDRYDLRKSVSNAALAKKPALSAFVEAMAANGYNVNMPEAQLDELHRQHYKDMQVQEFQGLVDGIKSIEGIGRHQKEVLDGEQRRSLDDVAQEAADTMASLKQRPAETARGLTRMDKAWLGLKQGARSLQASLLKMEQMFDWLDDKNPLGALNRTVFRPIADAGAHEMELHAKVKARMDELLAKNLVDVTKDGHKIYQADDLFDSETGKFQRFTKKEMLALAGNMGNRSNIDKLLKGEGWAEASVWNFLHKNMGKADWDFVEGYAKTFEDLYPEKLAMSRRLGNTDPDRVAPAPFETPHGKYAGWYWPMIYDPARAQDVAERGARKSDAMFENVYQRANTDTGRLNTRVEGYARPLLLSLDAIPKVLADEIHDVSYREAIINADKVISHPQVRDAMVSALSQEHYDQVRPWLQSIANDSKSDMKSLKWFDSLAHEARMRGTMVGLGFRATTMLMHGTTAGIESAAEVGPTWFAKGLQAFANPAAWKQNIDFITTRSQEMKARFAGEVDRDIRDNLKQLDREMSDPATSTIARGADAVKSRAYQGIAMLDMASAAPTWMAGYIKGMAPEAEGGLGLSEKDAVYFADKSVRNAHGGNGLKDMAAVQRGPEFFKLFTMFYSFWNHNVNRLMDTGRNAMDSETWKDSGKAGTVVMRTAAYVFAVQAIHGMFHQAQPGDENEHWYQWAGKAVANAAAGGIPIVRDIMQYALGESDYSVTPGAQLVSSLHQSQVDAMYAWEGRTVSDKWIKHSINNMGYLTNEPTGQVATTSQFLWDVDQGTEDPEGVKEWWNGVVSGHTK